MGFPIYRTQSVAANITPLYQLSLRAPILSVIELSTYTFPLTPSMLRAERSSMSTYNDTQGSPLTQGVTRVVDTYGLAPPIFTIEGTTGWDLHSADGFGLTGLDSIKSLQTFLATYADLNQALRIAGVAELFTLEFYDYFTGSFWQIEPVGPQVFQQDSQRPLLSYYRFKWVGVRPAGLINDILDSIGNVLSVGAQLSTSSLGSSISSTLSSYTPSGVTPTAISNTASTA